MPHEILGPMEAKIVSLGRLAEILQSRRSEGKKIGLITGAFDVIHVGHVRLAQFAKRHVDVLVAGVEQDETIRLSKGPHRPVNPLAARCDVLSAFYHIDFIFEILSVFQYGTDEADKRLSEIYQRLKPDVLITNITADRFWEYKKRSALRLGIGFLGQRAPKDNSSSRIARLIQKDI